MTTSLRSPPVPRDRTDRGVAANFAQVIDEIASPHTRLVFPHRRSFEIAQRRDACVWVVDRELAAFGQVCRFVARERATMFLVVDDVEIAKLQRADVVVRDAVRLRVPRR